MAHRRSTGIPGLSFSMRRALGISQAQARLSRQLGIPLSRAGRQRKMGRALGCRWVELLPPLLDLDQRLADDAAREVAVSIHILQAGAA